MFDIKLKKMIDGCKVISFDIFDTLITRCCSNPEDIFKIVEKKLNLTGADFQKERVKAELIARQVKKSEEITLKEIYNHVETLDMYKKQLAMQLEIETECEYCKENPYMKEIFNYCLIHKKKVLITSDMYLPEEVIVRILTMVGYIGYEKIFLSSSYGKKKSTGNLFKILISSTNVDKNSILHIGDNWRADYMIPKLLGLCTYHYNRNHDEDCTYRTLKQFLESKEISNKDFYYKFGYKILGPAILGYATWLKRQLDECHISNVYFMAREGKFIKKAFDLISDGSYKEHYLYVSRRSLTVPALAKLSSIDDFLAYRPMYSRVFVKTQIEKLGLVVSDFLKYRWCKEDILNEEIGALEEKLKKEIVQDMFSEAKKQGERELPFLIKYLKQEDMSGKFAVVDLGWNGSMQRALAQIFQDNGILVNMTGFFLAQRDEYYKNAKYISNYGYLFNYGKVSEKENLLLNSGTALLEFLFSADHGSTSKYMDDHDSVIPVLETYEYQAVLPIIQTCQDAAIDFIRDYIKENIVVKGTEKAYFQPMYEVLKRPSDDIIKNFGDLNSSDMNETELLLAPSVSFFPIKQFIRKFKEAGWKVGFLKRNLRISFAFEVYCFLRQQFNSRG